MLSTVLSYNYLYAIHCIRSNSSHTVFFFAGTFPVMFPQPIRRPCLFPHCLHCASLSPLTSTIKNAQKCGLLVYLL